MECNLKGRKVGVGTRTEDEGEGLERKQGEGKR
jgi:hypothetical protein